MTNEDLLQVVSIVKATVEAVVRREVASALERAPRQAEQTLLPPQPERMRVGEGVLQALVATVAELRTDVDALRATATTQSELPATRPEGGDGNRDSMAPSTNDAEADVSAPPVLHDQVKREVTELARAIARRELGLATRKPVPVVAAPVLVEYLRHRARVTTEEVARVLVERQPEMPMKAAEKYCAKLLHQRGWTRVREFDGVRQHRRWLHPDACSARADITLADLMADDRVRQTIDDLLDGKRRRGSRVISTVQLTQAVKALFPGQKLARGSLERLMLDRGWGKQQGKTHGQRVTLFVLRSLDEREPDPSTEHDADGY